VANTMVIPPVNEVIECLLDQRHKHPVEQGSNDISMQAEANSKLRTHPLHRVG
jgi:hypothetical protein